MNSDSPPDYHYQVGGTLPPYTPTYVKREADEQLYQQLKSGEFCYVSNSRQMGKSSLWVQTQQRLERLKTENFICAAIDLTEIGKATREEWYEGFTYLLLETFNSYLETDWERWWSDHKSISSSQRLRQVIGNLLLESVALKNQKIVIFIDEIDFVRQLDFSTDDFFALIRSCFNSRANKPKYNRLTFCLLGVATPSDLIKSQQVTPFNIGTAIELKGFQLKEAKPLTRGLQGKVDNPEEVMNQILHWTGGQPFLTQRLCSLVVKENNPTPNIPELVHSQIIDNWEAQDEQEHLRTIKNRILSNEQKASHLLELYRKVLKPRQVTLNNSSEERELQLSGLVVKRGNVLEVYNPIYARVFDESWLDSELEKLRPYAENYRAWLESGKTDVSRLLRGQALKDAEAWAKGKNLGGEDLDFLGASRAQEREEEVAQKEKEILTLAYQKAQRRIRRGTGILIGTGLIVIISWVVAVNKLGKIRAVTKNVDRLSQLSGELHQTGETSAASQAREYIGLSYEIKAHEFKQAFLLASISLACQNLSQNFCHEEQEPIEESLKLLQKQKKLNTEPIGAQVGVFAYYIQGQLFNKQNQPKKARESYTKAFTLLKNSSYNPYKQNIPTQILSEEDIENIHYHP